jgi:exopolyphosphatase / guanosine-5'-triphosphate,3'-diphosphate pyrophosphatase
VNHSLFPNLHSPNLRIAGIDIGTNSVRYLAVEAHPSSPSEIIARGLATPRLGEGLTGTGRISDKAVNRTISKLSLIKNELESMGVSEFRCVGTEALRLAGNGDIFIRRAAEIGLTINILTGEEEARLIYAGATDNLDLSTSGYILVDPGGGSTEIITAMEGKEPHFVSLPLGCVRLKELAGDHGLDWMREYCHDLLEKDFPAAPAKESVSSDRKTLIGLGGTFTTLAAIHLQLTDYDGDRIHGLPIPTEEIGRIGEKLFRCDADEMKKIPGMEPSRADIIISGITIVQSIMDHFRFSQVIISDRGLLWGLIPKYSEGNPSVNTILS